MRVRVVAAGVSMALASGLAVFGAAEIHGHLSAEAVAPYNRDVSACSGPLGELAMAHIGEVTALPQGCERFKGRIPYDDETSQYIVPTQASFAEEVPIETGADRSSSINKAASRSAKDAALWGAIFGISVGIVAEGRRQDEEPLVVAHAGATNGES